MIRNRDPRCCNPQLAFPGFLGLFFLQNLDLCRLGDRPQPVYVDEYVRGPFVLTMALVCMVCIHTYSIFSTIHIYKFYT